MLIFSENTFCTEIANNVICNEKLSVIKDIRRFHPEIKHWNDAAIYFAWGQYSQDIYAVQWVDWVNNRELGFMAYCYICQVLPSFNFGGTGLYDTEIWDLGEQKPWEQNQPVVLPECFV